MLLMDMLFYMVQFHVDSGVGGPYPVGDGLGKKHGAVLPASASKRDHQMVEMPFQIIINTLTHNAFNMVEELVYLGFGGEVLHHFPVAPRLGFELRFTTRVGQGATVEHKTSAIAAEIVGVAFAEGETIDRHGER